MKSRHFSTLLAVFALTIALAGRAEANCVRSATPPPCEAYWGAQAVFVGTVKKVSYSDIYQRGEGDSRWNVRRRITRFSVETAYKGVEGKVAEVVTEEHTWATDPPADGERRTPTLYHPPPTDCDYRFDEGETYFVYAYPGEKDGTLNVPMNRTGKLEDAAEDLKFVKGLPRAAPTARIFGHITRNDRTVGGDNHEWLPLAGIKVTARSDERTFEALTDAGGKYELKALPPGSYHVTPVYPPHFFTDDDDDPQLTEVDARACARLDFHTYSNVRLKGRVVDAEGRPLPGIKVDLIAAGGNETALAGKTGYTDAEGHYELAFIPGGRYLLVFNMISAPNLTGAPDTRVSRPRTYYPGVWSVAQATVITIVEGENPPAYDLQLLPPNDRAVEIVVTWPDGRPVGDAYLRLEDPDYEGTGSATVVKKVDGQEGRYQATGIDGKTYWAHAHVNFEGGQMHAEPLKFDLRKGAAPIKLVITSPGGHCPHYRRQ